MKFTLKALNTELPCKFLYATAGEVTRPRATVEYQVMGDKFLAAFDLITGDEVNLKFPKPLFGPFSEPLFLLIEE